MDSLAWFLVGVNVAGFLNMGYDKWKAVRGGSRLPEAQLLTMAAFGAVGVWLGVFAFRHKTQKKSFQVKLVAASAVCFAWMWWVYAPAAG